MISGLVQILQEGNNDQKEKEMGKGNRWDCPAETWGGNLGAGPGLTEHQRQDPHLELRGCHPSGPEGQSVKPKRIILGL